MNTFTNRYVKALSLSRLWIRWLITWNQWGVWWDTQHIQQMQHDMDQSTMLRCQRLHRIKLLNNRL